MSEPQGEDGLPGVTLAEDDDGGEGTNSRITITLPHDGIYWIHAGPLFADGTGRYTISVTQQ
ncbi:MAG TPA: hypothetical protein VHG93_14460 [Longimicrobium sp.]|nr:hypothetical protein [Longimicrobium sp.]